MPIYKKQNKPYLVKVNYTDKYGISHQVVRQNKATATLTGAKKVELQLLNEFCSGKTPQAAQDITMDKLIENYFDYAEMQTRKSTKRHTEGIFRIYIKDYFKKMPLFDLDVMECQKWKKYINSCTNLKTGKSLSIDYKNTIYKMFNKLINYAITFYNLPFNPLKRIGPFKDVNLIEEELHYWTLEEFNKFIAMFEDFCRSQDGKTLDDLRYWGYYVNFNILYFCGLRKGESYCLTWKKLINIKGVEHLKINESMNQKVKNEEYEITGPKNKSSHRKVPVCDRLSKILHEHRARYENVYDFSDDFFICGGIDPLWDSTLASYKNKFAKKAELPQIRIHDFRHSFASFLINGGVEITTVSKWMGHATVEMTWNRYNHLYPEKEDEALKYMNRANSTKI